LETGLEDNRDGQEICNQTCKICNFEIHTILLLKLRVNYFIENVYSVMGQGSSTPGPAGKDGIAGKDGKDGKDAVVDYIQLVNKTVNDEGFKTQIKGLLNDMSFKKTVTDYISANADTFRGPKGETEFKNLTEDDQAKIINKLITDNITTFSVALMANQSFKDAVLETLKANPSDFRGPQGVQGPMGIGIKSATYNSTTGNLQLINTNDQSLGEFSMQGSPGPKGDTGPAGTVNTPENVTWLQGKTMWCADGSCVVPGGNTIIPLNKRLTTSANDNFTYANNTVGHYSLGWNLEGQNALGYLSGYYGLRFFTNGQERMNIDVNGTARVKRSIEC